MMGWIKVWVISFNMLEDAKSGI